MVNSSKIKSTFDYLTDHARHVENAAPYLPGNFDPFFKALVTAEWCVKSNGDVESASGYHALIEVTPTDSTDPEFLTLLEEALYFGDLPPAGWYVTIETDQGFIYVYPFANQYGAEAAYEELEQRYENWLQLGDEEV